MKTFACLVLVVQLLVFCTAAGTRDYNNFKVRPQTTYGNSGDKDVKILRNDQEMKADGSYHYQYETSNGILGNEQGVGGQSVQGASSYVSPEGIEIKLTYTADETGYHPVGDHIPKTPDYILRSLEYIRTHPYQVKEYNGARSKLTSRSVSNTIPQLSTEIVAPPFRSARARRIAYPTEAFKTNVAPKQNYQNRAANKYSKY